MYETCVDMLAHPPLAEVQLPLLFARSIDWDPGHQRLLHHPPTLDLMQKHLMLLLSPLMQQLAVPAGQHTNELLRILRSCKKRSQFNQ